MDIWKIGISILMTNGASSVLSRISHQLLGVHVSTSKINANLGRMASLIGGVGAVMVGSGLIVGFAKIASHGKDLLHQQVLLKNLGLDNQKIVEATAAAWKATRDVAGTHVAENLKFVGELTSVFGNVDEAIQAMPKFAMMAQVLSGVTGRDAEKSNVAYIAARAMELRGALIDPKTHQIDPALFEKQLDMMVKAVVYSHGKVGPEQWLNFVQQAGPAARMLDDQGMKTAYAVIQAMGGHRAGTALSSLFQQFFGGIMTQRVAGELIKEGILDPNKMEVRRGGAVVVQPGGIKGMDALLHDPLAFFMDTIIPAMKGHGSAADQQMLQKVYRIFGRATTQRLAAELIQNLPQILKERKGLDSAKGIADAFANLAKEDPILRMKAFEAAWDNFLTAVGGPLLAAAIPWLIRFTDALNYMNEVVLAHPTAIKMIGEGLLVLGAALIAGGAVAILAALGPAGWIAAGIVVLAAALAMLPKGTFDQFIQGVTNVASRMDQMAKAHTWSDFLFGQGPMFQFKYKGSLWEQIFGPQAEAPKKQSYIPPGGGSTVHVAMANVNLDGRKVGEAQVRFMVREMSGAAQGSPYHDATYSTAPMDLALVG